MVRHTLQLLLLIVSFTAFSSAPAANNHSGEKVILIFGDSLSAGYGLKVGEGWVNLLIERIADNNLNYKIVNASISGNTSGNGLGRLNSDLDRHQPDILILELGGNDGLRGHPPSLFKSNMTKIIKRSQDKDIQVVLLGIKLPTSYGRRYRQAFEDIYQELADSFSLPLVPFFMDKVGINSALMQNDRIHPNAMGQPQLLNNVWPVLKPLLN